MPITLTANALSVIHGAARAADPGEACGLLLGEDDHIHTAQPAANVHSAPLTHFEVDPAALLAAHRNARTGGPALLGYFHSHPTGHSRPSATDCEHSSGDGRVWAIEANGEITLWRDGDNGFQALSYTVVDG